jgi:hypothetical protein
MQLTDLDLLAIEVGPTLSERRVIGESKTGTGRSAAKPLDRILWLRGVLALTEADHAELTSALRPSRRVRELAATLGVTAQSIEDVVRREERIRVQEVADLGSQGVGAALQEQRVRGLAAREPDLDRAYWVLRSDVWFIDPWLALKRCVALIAYLSKRWTPAAADSQHEVVTWLLAESVAVFSLQLVLAVGLADRLGGAEVLDYVSERLSVGPGDRREMRELSEAVDRYVAGLLRQANAPAALKVQSMGAFAPTPPEWAGSIAEVVRRFAARPDLAKHVPRYIDFVVHEGLVRKRPLPDELSTRLGVSDLDGVQRFVRVVASFLSGQAQLPPDVVKVLAGNGVPDNGELPPAPEHVTTERLQLPLDS